MKFPRVKIIWDDSNIKQPICVTVQKLTNGYLIGRTFFATEDLLVKHLAEYVKDPNAYYSVPFYKD